MLFSVSWRFLIVLSGVYTGQCCWWWFSQKLHHEQWRCVKKDHELYGKTAYFHSSFSMLHICYSGVLYTAFVAFSFAISLMPFAGALILQLIWGDFVWILIKSFHMLSLKEWSLRMIHLIVFFIFTSKMHSASRHGCVWLRV